MSLRRVVAFALAFAIGLAPGMSVKAGSLQPAQQIAQKKPAADPPPVPSPILVKFREDSGIVASRFGLRAEDGSNRSLPTLDWFGQPLEVRRLFDGDVEKTAARRLEIQSRTQESVPDLNRWAIVEIPDNAKRDPREFGRLLRELKENPSIEIAYPRPSYAPADAGAFSRRPTASSAPRSTTPNFEHLQTYRNSSYADGFNIDFVENWPGARGGNVKLIDIEGDWNWNHEDLPTPFYTGGVYGGPLEDQQIYRNHGMNTMGIISGQDNGFGVTGIVPDAQVGSQVSGVAWDDPANPTDLSAEFNTAAAQLATGDVILIELQAKIDPSDPNDPWRPVEYWQANFDAIRVAALSGIVVIEPAGNGGLDLDVELPNFVRFSETDSYAIMVGGYRANNVVTFNHGQRVDLSGPGEGVTTTGVGSLYGLDEGLGENFFYDDTYAGTSSAAAIVAGAAASFQSMFKEESGNPMSAIGLREILRQTGHEIEGATYPIGTRPDIAEAMRLLYDGGAPEAIDDLFFVDRTSNKIRVAWDAPLDEYRGMGVTSYDLRYSTSAITEANFDSATPFTEVMEPGPPGNLQAATVTGLVPSTNYHLAIRSADPAGNLSPISNVVTATTEAPAPEIVFESGNLDFPPAVLTGTSFGQVAIENQGSIDLTITECLPLHGPDVLFEVVSCPSTIPAGQSAELELSASPFAAGFQGGAVRLTSNDPDTPMAFKGVAIEGIEIVVDPVTIQVEQGLSASSSTQVHNLGNVQVTVSAPDRTFRIDVSHGQANPLSLANFALAEGLDVQYSSSAPTAEDLASTDILYVPGAESAWTAAEAQVVADWVAAGGSLFVDVPVSFDAPVYLDPLLAAFGAAGSLAVGPPFVATGDTAFFAASPLFEGLTTVPLTNPIVRVDATALPAGFSALLQTPDGQYDKGFSGSFGAGEVVVFADLPFADVGASEDSDRLFRNAMSALADWPIWARYPGENFPLFPLSSGSLQIDAHAETLALGSYTITESIEILGVSIPFDLTVEVVDVTISNIAKNYQECDETTISWETDLSVPCQFRYRVEGFSTWSGPYPTAEGTQHQVTVPTTLNTRYDGRIECLDVHEFTFKTLTSCIGS